MFLSGRKGAQQTAQQMLAGHVSLVAWWTLRHAGVFDAILHQESSTGEGLNPLVHALRTSMAPDVLRALLDYLATQNLITFKNDLARLTPEGRALLDHEDPVLELLRAYEPVLAMSEHLLAKLKSYGPASGAGGGVGGVYKKTEYLTNSQAARFAPELFPAVASLIKDHRFSHLLDLSCATGDLLIHIATHLKNTVGVGVSSDSFAVKKANDAIEAAQLEKRLIAVPGNPLDVCTDTQRAFDRIGISRQLWAEIDLLLLPQVLSEHASNTADSPSAAPAIVTKTLAATRKNFPTAHLLLIESLATPRFDKNYYAPEYALALRLAKSSPWDPDKWRDAITAAKYSLLAEVGVTTEGLTLLLCKPHPTPKSPPPTGR